MANNTGSLTVEATVVMLVSLWITFLIMMSAFYCYDMNRLYSVAESLAENEAFGVYGDGDGISLEERFAKELETGFFFIEDCNTVIDMDGISIEYSGTWKCPVQLWVFANDGFEYRGIAKSERTSPEKILRVVQGVIKGLGK